MLFGHALCVWARYHDLRWMGVPIEGSIRLTISVEMGPSVVARTISSEVKVELELR